MANKRITTFKQRTERRVKNFLFSVELCNAERDVLRAFKLVDAINKDHEDCITASKITSYNAGQRSISKGPS